MEKRMLVQGNDAVGWGALGADCDGFFGYPITPQNEVTEWFSREFPKRGKVFVQSESETGSINMLYGGAAAGFRVMTSTASPGWSLMQEGLSQMAAAELPCVVVLVQRGGPGQGSVRHAQMDYTCVTRGGGHGGYKNVVLAAASVQEVHDLMQLAFHIADKYVNPVVVMLDGIVGLVAESLEVKTIDFGAVPEKDWAVRGRGKQKDGQRRFIHSYPSGAPPPGGYPNYVTWLGHLGEKFQQMADAEVRFETYQTEGADLVVVAFGYVSRVCKEAIGIARSRGLKVGLLRPVSLWPFPYGAVGEMSGQAKSFLVVEDNLGQMVEDVRAAAQEGCEVHHLGILSRHLPTDGGMILPGRVLEEIERLL